MYITSCAFTGHRPHKFPWRHEETDSRCIALKEALTNLIKKLTFLGITDFFSGMADGSDVWLSQTVLALREHNTALKLHCVLPCDGQADSWSASAQKRYYAILNQADSVEYVNHEYYDGCMLARNRRLVELSSLVLAVYNGERRGGTAATVRYAKKMERSIIVIDPITMLVSCEERGTSPCLFDLTQ